MRRHWPNILAASLVFAACAAPLPSTAFVPRMTPVDDAEIDAVIEKFHATGEFDGVVVVQRGAAIVHARAIGRRDGPGSPPLTLSDRFPLASVMKQVTALLVMQEVEAGRLALADPLGALLPDVPLAAREVTVRQLLQHRSGLPAPETGVPEGEVPAFYLRPPTALGDSEAEALGCLAGVSAPAGEFRYNNCDYIVLGAVLERRTGRPFAALVRERVIDRLGLASWGVATRTDPTPALVPGHTSDGRRGPAIALATYGASGALYGDAIDLARWSRALLAHELLGAAATATMLTGEKELGYQALGSWAYEQSPAVHPCGWSSVKGPPAASTCWPSRRRATASRSPSSPTPSAPGCSSCGAGRGSRPSSYARWCGSPHHELGLGERVTLTRGAERQREGDRAPQRGR